MDKVYVLWSRLNQQNEGYFSTLEKAEAYAHTMYSEDEDSMWVIKEIEVK